MQISKADRFFLQCQHHLKGHYFLFLFQCLAKSLRHVLWALSKTHKRPQKTKGKYEHEYECLVCYFLFLLTLFCTELPENCIYLNQSELSNFFMYIICIGNHMIFLVQFGINKHAQFVVFEKINKCLFVPNCTRKIMWLRVNNKHEKIRDSSS